MTKPPKAEAAVRNGFVLADKPAGLGSAALVGRLRRELGGIRAGHTGTLDRFASGLMLLPVGRATSLAEQFLHADKSYAAVFRFGSFTDTHDPTGKVLAEKDDATVREYLGDESTRDRIGALVRAWRRQNKQTPPLYSALKKDGRRFSDRARCGDDTMPAARNITVYSVENVKINADEGTLAVDLSVSGGTYIRSFARDLSEALDFPLHLAALRRTGLGSHRLDDPRLWVPDQNAPEIVSPLEILPEWPTLSVPPDVAADIVQGRRPALAPEDLPGEGRDFFFRDDRGEVLAWCRSMGGGRYEFRRVFVNQ